MHRSPRFHVQIRDPIHGTLRLSREELALVDHPAYQRLRTIKQLGLADLAFPGATHTRYAHGLGTMHIASSMFTVLAEQLDLRGADRERLLQTLRLAALFHDLGHAPLSHTTEAFMPAVRDLGLGIWLEGEPTRQASHEDYTLKIITASDLTRVIEQRFRDEGVTPNDIATLVAGRAPTSEHRARFLVGGRDWMPVLRQCVSSELDADRMDYLLRDSYFAGVPYGRYDHEWLLENLHSVERDGAIYLGLDARASFGFEDYLLSRYHMFLSVYFHHVPIAYEVMLRRFHADQTDELHIPADVEGYLQCDDVYFWDLLRRSRSPWARRIVERRAHRMLVEVKDLVDDLPLSGKEKPPLGDVDAICEALKQRGIDAISHSVKSQLSKYFRTGVGRAPIDSAPPVYIVEGGRSVPIEEYTPLYRRYAGAIHLRRVYVDAAQADEAREVLRILGKAAGTD